jgi:bacterioferritin
MKRHTSDVDDHDDPIDSVVANCGPPAIDETMRNALLHPRTLGYLGRTLSLEYSAVQQYMTQAALCEAWGLGEAAERFRRETVEEMQHADRIVKRMLTLGVAPNASQLSPPAVARNLVDLLRQDAVLEAEIITLYAEATRFCERIRDRENAAFFDELLREEMDHAAEINEWLSSLGAREPRNHDERVFF